MSCSQHVWLSAAAVIVTVIVCGAGAVWWLVGPGGQMATRDDIADVRRELRESTRARQRIVEEIGRLVREAERPPT